LTTGTTIGRITNRESAASSLTAWAAGFPISVTPPAPKIVPSASKIRDAG
jgi:hypothetical protein